MPFKEPLNSTNTIKLSETLSEEISKEDIDSFTTFINDTLKSKSIHLVFDLQKEADHITILTKLMEFSSKKLFVGSANSNYSSLENLYLAFENNKLSFALNRHSLLIDITKNNPIHELSVYSYSNLSEKYYTIFETISYKKLILYKDNNYYYNGTVCSASYDSDTETFTQIDSEKFNSSLKIVGALKNRVKTVKVTANLVLKNDDLSLLNSTVEKIPNCQFTFNSIEIEDTYKNIETLKELWHKSKSIIKTVKISNITEKNILAVVEIIKQHSNTTEFNLDSDNVLKITDEVGNQLVFIEDIFTINSTFYSSYSKQKMQPTKDHVFYMLENLSLRNTILNLVKEKQNISSILKTNTLDFTDLYLLSSHLDLVLGYLKKNEDIQKLVISGEHFLKENDISKLFEALKQIPYITSVTINNLRLTKTAVLKLIEVLKLNNLIELNIDNTGLSDAEFTLITNEIKNNLPLISLSICNNKFSSSNHSGLAQSLVGNKYLTKIHCNIISNEPSLKSFFSEIGWDKKSTQKCNYRIQDIEVLTCKREQFNVFFNREPRTLNDSEKTAKKMALSYDTYINKGKEKRDKDETDLLTIARLGTDLEKFKSLLKNLSPYTLAQEGYLQHVLVINQRESFLSYLFEAFHINPWLRFNNKTILDLANDHKNQTLIDLIQAHMDKLKGKLTTSNNNLSSALISPNKKRSGDFKQSDNDPNKIQKMTTANSAHAAPNTISAPQRRGTPSINNDNSNDAFDNNNSNKNKGSNPSVHSDNDDINNGVTGLDNDEDINSIHDISLNEKSVFTPHLYTSKSENTLFIMQAIQSRNTALLRSHWCSDSSSRSFRAFTQQTPLQYAIQSKSYDVLSTLCELGEDINENDSEGFPLLYQCIRKLFEKNNTVGQVDEYILLIKSILDNNVNIEAKVKDNHVEKNTFLHKAVQMGNYRCAKMLLNQPLCPVNELNSKRYTPLMDAVEIMHFQLVARLLLDRRHTRATVLNALKLAKNKEYTEISNLLENHLAIMTQATDQNDLTAGIQWSRTLTVQFSKPALGNKPQHIVSVDKEHAWLHSQNQFMRTSLSSDKADKESQLKALGNPVTASLTFVLTTSPYQRHANHSYTDITVPLDFIKDYHVTQAYKNASNGDDDDNLSNAEDNDNLSNADDGDNLSRNRELDREKRSVIRNTEIQNLLPHFKNYRTGYSARTEENIKSAHSVDFAQTFRHGEISLVTFLSQRKHVKEIAFKLTQQNGFVPQAKFIGLVFNIASPRYACENCEFALLATQHPKISTFLTLLADELKSRLVLPKFSPLRMITCVSSYIPFNSNRILSDNHKALTIDFRHCDVILSKDISEPTEKGSYTQFKSNQL